MEDEEILDSGQIYKDPNEETPISLPELELDQHQEVIDWEPLKGGGTSFKTHKLVMPDDDSIMFTTTIGGYLFGLIFLLTGLGLVISSLIQGSFFGLFGLVFLLSGVYLLDSFTIPIIFNKRIGLYWKARIPLFHRLFSDKEAFSVQLDDIKAVQILQELVNSDDGNYSSYEINLVLTNNKRLNVVDHGDLKSAMKDAQHLAEFLEVPFLNGIDR